MSEGHSWFTDQLATMSDDQISWWARAVSFGRWGPIRPDTQRPAGVDYAAPINEKRYFLGHAIRRAFAPGSYRCFLIPPTHALSNRLTESFQTYAWIVWNGLGSIPTVYPGQQVSVSYPPGWGIAKPPSGFVGHSAAQPPSQPPPMLHARIDAPTPSPPSQPSNASNTVGRGKKASFAKVVASPAAAPSNEPFRPARRPATVNSIKWILRFPEGNKPFAATRPPALVVVDKINTACRERYGVKAVLADWISPSNNLAITFAPGTKDKNIETATATIISLFCPENPNGVSFRKAVTWSKILFPRVPCRAISSQTYDGDEMSTNETWSKDALLEEVKASHPLLHSAYFTEFPDWTVENVPFNAQVANLVFSIEDPDRSIADSLTRSELIMFATRIRPQAWKEKINLTQCPRCLRLGPAHPACQIRCLKCGSPNHSVEAHNQNCKACKDTGRPLAEIVAESWVCAHTKCINCGGPHVATDTSCPGRNEAVRAARAKKSGMVGQTILDPRSLGRPGPSRPFRR